MLPRIRASSANAQSLERARLSPFDSVTSMIEQEKMKADEFIRFECLQIDRRQHRSQPPSQSSKDMQIQYDK